MRAAWATRVFPSLQITGFLGAPSHTQLDLFAPAGGECADVPSPAHLQITLVAGGEKVGGDGGIGLYPPSMSSTNPIAHNLTPDIRLGTPLPNRAPSPRAPPRSSRAPFLPAAGALVSEPTCPLRLDAVFLHGSDLLRFGPDGAHARASTTQRTIDVSGLRRQGAQEQGGEDDGFWRCL
ncbi:hypothetical protein C8034_v000796 [Colletotrichum sidae]|uniref:Uncharacterized protein n=1 Tax=Colletotrichum sidae TaxID=1347389 RepID=A0A4R8TLT4_9PEZI|nr:hypothetical protein C8034_v000796 [Colletotrichum sidae]